MSVHITVSKEALVITVGWAASILGFKRSIQVPISNVVCVRKAEAASLLKGIPRLGIHIPGVVAIGTFWNVMRRQKEYWNIRKGADAIEIFMKDHQYHRLVIGFENPDKAIDTILKSSSSLEKMSSEYPV